MELFLPGKHCWKIQSTVLYRNSKQIIFLSINPFVCCLRLAGLAKYSSLFWYKHVNTHRLRLHELYPSSANFFSIKILFQCAFFSHSMNFLLSHKQNWSSLRGMGDADLLYSSENVCMSSPLLTKKGYLKDHGHTCVLLQHAELSEHIPCRYLFSKTFMIRPFCHSKCSLFPQLANTNIKRVSAFGLCKKTACLFLNLAFAFYDISPFTFKMLSLTTRKWIWQLLSSVL